MSPYGWREKDQEDDIFEKLTGGILGQTGHVLKVMGATETFSKNRGNRRNETSRGDAFSHKFYIELIDSTWYI